MKTRLDQLVSGLCDEIDDLRAELESVKHERDELQRKYIECLDSSIQHGHAMMGALLQSALEGK